MILILILKENAVVDLEQRQLTLFAYQQEYGTSIHTWILARMFEHIYILVSSIYMNFYSSLLSGSASFLCAALMSPQRTKQYCPQIEYFAPLIHVWSSTLLG